MGNSIILGVGVGGGELTSVGERESLGGGGREVD